LMHVHFAGTELLTGLPEYRNGGLLIDTGLLTLKPADAKRGLEQYQINAMKEGQPNMEVVPMFSVDDDVIVEWRALTVGFLDELCFEVNSQLGLVGSKKLSLAQVLEAGSWKVSKIVGWRKKQEHSLTNTTGRQRTCRGHKTQHQGTTDHDCVGWHRLLIDTPHHTAGLVVLFHPIVEHHHIFSFSRRDLYLFSTFFSNDPLCP
jgi:hypothetical protein